MRLERSKNAVRNAFFGTINTMTSVLLPFIVRTVFIYTLGTEYLGLNSLFTSILTMLNLTELGFSSAVVFCMYKPIAEDDTDSINALLLLYKTVYRYIGAIILVVGALLIPFLGYLINGTCPSDINLTAVYLVYLLNTVLSYFLFAYLGALISAFQREDVISKVNTLVRIVMSALQIATLLTIRNYYVYIAIMPVFTIINNLRTAIIARKMFPQYRAFGELKPEYRNMLKEKVRGLVINKVSAVSRNAFDSIFISMFLGLVETGKYNNYYFVMNSVRAIITVLVASIVAGVGNSISLDSPEKNYDDLRKMNFIYMWIAGWFTACMLSLYQPFMKIWVGEDLMYPMLFVVLICTYFYLRNLSDVRYAYEQALGLWWDLRYRYIAEVICNLILNYTMGKYFGVYGIVSATMISIFFINFLYGTRSIFKIYFKKQSIAKYFLTQLQYAMAALATCGLTYGACYLLPGGVIGLLLRAGICLIIPNSVLWMIYRKTKIYGESIPWILGRIKTKKASQ